MDEDIEVTRVAKEVSKILDYIDDAVFPVSGDKSYDHLYLMLNEVHSGEVIGCKAHRYIGWVQCAICFYTNTNSEVFRDLNRRFQFKKEIT